MADKNTQPAAWTDADNGVAVWANQADLAEVLRDILGISYDVRLCQTRPVVHQGNTVFLCVLEAPAVALCQAICNGTELRSALEDIRADIAAALACWRTARDRVVLVDVAMLRQEPESFLKHFNIDADDETLNRLRGAIPSAPDAVCQSLSRDRLQFDADLAVLAGEFSAAVLPFAAADPDMALQLFLDGQHDAEERTLLRAQQHSMYEQMDALYRGKLHLEAQLEQVHMERQKLADKQPLLAKALRDCEKNLKQEKENRATAEHLAEIWEQENHGLRAEVHKLYNSRSFRLMAPLRFARRILRGNR